MVLQQSTKLPAERLCGFESLTFRFHGEYMHDKYGKSIRVGDEVVLRGRVTDAVANGDGTYCSVRVQLDGDWDGRGNQKSEWFAAKQLEVVDSPTD